jgi:hypothetical protein
MFKKSGLLGAVCASVFSICAIPSHAALVDNGGGLIYDTVLDITWAQTGPDGGLTWSAAKSYAAGLTLGGVSGWRLPYMSVAAGPGGLVPIGTPVDCNTASEADCRDNEMGYMFYYNLGGTLNSSIEDSGNSNRDLFPNLLPNNVVNFWTGQDIEGPPLNVATWVFSFANDGSNTSIAGSVGNELKFDNMGAWAVHDGNISAVPVPAAMWLFGSGLLGLIGMARRKKAA